MSAKLTVFKLRERRFEKTVPGFCPPASGGRSSEDLRSRPRIGPSRPGIGPPVVAIVDAQHVRDGSVHASNPLCESRLFAGLSGVILALILVFGYMVTDKCRYGLFKLPKYANASERSCAPRLW